MNIIHLLKPKLDVSGSPPSVAAQQAAEEAKKKKKTEKKFGEELIEKEDGGPGSGPQKGGEKRKPKRRAFDPKNRRTSRGTVSQQASLAKEHGFRRTGEERRK